MAQLRSVACHMGSPQCYLLPDTSEHTPPPHTSIAMQAGTQFIYPGGMEG